MRQALPTHNANNGVEHEVSQSPRSSHLHRHAQGPGALRPTPRLSRYGASQAARVERRA